MRIFRDLEQAKSILLRRVHLAALEVSPSVAQRVKEVFGEGLSPDEAVERIIHDVQTEGDSALFRYSKSIDGVELTQLEVSKDDVAEAYRTVDGQLLDALKFAAERVRSFHLAQRQDSWFDFEEGLGTRVRPLERVGIYVPGGTACYPSTVLMTAIPAKVAGVTEVVLTTPPSRFIGTIPAPTLVAADIAKVDRIFKLGGAQAIAALAWATDSGMSMGPWAQPHAKIPGRVVSRGCEVPVWKNPNLLTSMPSISDRLSTLSLGAQAVAKITISKSCSLTFLSRVSS